MVHLESGQISLGWLVGAAAFLVIQMAVADLTISAIGLAILLAGTVYALGVWYKETGFTERVVSFV